MNIKIVLKKYLPRLLLVWAAFFLVSLIVYFFVLSPQNVLKESLNGKRDQLILQEQQAQDAASKKIQEQLKAQVESLKNDAGLFVINVGNASNITFDISRLAEQFKLSSVKVTTKDNQPVQNCSRIAENKVHITFSSTFNGFFALLNSLERHRPVVFIDMFSVTLPRQEQSGNEAAMDVSVYVSRPLESSSGNI